MKKISLFGGSVAPMTQYQSGKLTMLNECLHLFELMDDYMSQCDSFNKSSELSLRFSVGHLVMFKAGTMRASVNQA